MRKNKTFIIAGLVGALLAYGASQLVAWSGEVAQPPAGLEATELRKLREQVHKLEGSVASSERMAREAQVTAQSVQAAASSHVQAPTAPERRPEPASQGQGDETAPAQSPSAPAHEITPQEVVQHLDERFFGESHDLAWSREAMPRAERIGVLLPEGARVVSLECRNSMCRLEMSHPSLESFQGFVQQRLLGGEPAWDGAIITALKSDPGQPGGVEAVAYLARDGTDLSAALLESP